MDFLKPRYSKRSDKPVDYTDDPSSPHHEIDRTYQRYYDYDDKCWKDAVTDERCEAPPIDELRDVTADMALGKLKQLVPELEHVLSAYRTQFIDRFVEVLIEKTQGAASKELVSATRMLLSNLMSSKAEEAHKNSSWGWTLENKITAVVDNTVRNLVQTELTERLKKNPGLIKDAVDNALKTESIAAIAHDAVTPKIIDLIKELRLELTAGAKKNW